MQQKEGEEHLDEEAKLTKQKMLRFRIMTRMFYMSEEEKKKPVKKKEHPFQLDLSQQNL